MIIAGKVRKIRKFIITLIFKKETWENKSFKSNSEIKYCYLCWFSEWLKQIFFYSLLVRILHRQIIYLRLMIGSAEREKGYFRLDI